MANFSLALTRARAAVSSRYQIARGSFRIYPALLFQFLLSFFMVFLSFCYRELGQDGQQQRLKLPFFLFIP